MTAFDVYLNDRKLCRAGVGRDGVLNAIVNWVRLTGPAAAAARRERQPLEEMRLDIGGLAKGVHQRWPSGRLKTGDRVTVEVVAARTVDPPIAKKPHNPARALQQERRYYLHLKKKFEGAAPRRPKRASGALLEEETKFLNVDLDLWSRTPLGPLVEAFGKRVIVNHVGTEGPRRHRAHLMLSDSGYGEDCDRLVRRFVQAVKGLPRAARTRWRQTDIRTFNIGVQAAARPQSYELALQPETVRAVESVDAGLVYTVYGIEP